jgi:hypothetical protein
MHVQCNLRPNLHFPSILQLLSAAANNGIACIHQRRLSWQRPTIPTRRAEHVEESVRVRFAMGAMRKIIVFIRTGVPGPGSRASIGDPRARRVGYRPIFHPPLAFTLSIPDERSSGGGPRQCRRLGSAGCTSHDDMVQYMTLVGDSLRRGGTMARGDNGRALRLAETVYC